MAISKHSAVHRVILTKHLAPAGRLGSRVKATVKHTAIGSVTLRWNASLNAEQNHVHAAEQLAKRLGLSGIMVGGTLPASDYDYGFVVVGRKGFEN